MTQINLLIASGFIGWFIAIGLALAIAANYFGWIDLPRMFK